MSEEGGPPPSGETPDDRITVEEALEDVKGNEDSSPHFEYAFTEAYSSAALHAEDKFIRAEGLRSHFIHKGWWSGVLLITIVFMVGFQSVLIGLVGAGIWDFTKYSWLLPVLMIQYLAQIVGLGVFVVRSLFNTIN